MVVKIKPEEFPLIRDTIETICGIRVGDGKAYLMESRLSRLLEETGCDSFTSFHLKMKNSLSPELKTQIINAMSTQETLWFRDNHPFKVIREKLLPEFAADVRSGKRHRLRIWSAASSTGQEAYSIAMIIIELLARHPHLQRHMFEIRGTDIATTAVETAQRGRYDRIAMGRGLPPEYRARHFTEDGRYCLISDVVKHFVTFEQFNLQSSLASLGKFDIVLCRNVAIYFSDEFKRDLYQRIRQIFVPPGYLFLGASESISAHSSAFDLVDHNGSIFYRVKEA